METNSDINILKESYKQILDALPIGISYYDANEVRQYMNRAHMSILGIEAGISPNEIKKLPRSLIDTWYDLRKGKAVNFEFKLDFAELYEKYKFCTKRVSLRNFPYCQR